MHMCENINYIIKIKVSNQKTYVQSNKLFLHNNPILFLKKRYQFNNLIESTVSFNAPKGSGSMTRFDFQIRVGFE